MKITYELINSFKPCYMPEYIGIMPGYEASIPGFIINYRDKVKSKADIIWVLARREFMPEKDRLLFSVWCARQVPHLMTDKRSIAALDIAEKYAYDEATKEELAAVWVFPWDVADASWVADWADWGAAATCDAQIDTLLAYFEVRENNLHFSWKI